MMMMMMMMILIVYLEAGLHTRRRVKVVAGPRAHRDKWKEVGLRVQHHEQRVPSGTVVLEWQRDGQLVCEASG